MRRAALAFPGGAPWLAAVTLLMLAGCSGGQKASKSVEIPVASPAPTTTFITRASVYPLGLIPFDLATTPVHAPDGSAIATLAGLPQPAALRLAIGQQQMPSGARVDVLRPIATDVSGSPGRASLQLVFSLPQPMLLGRSADEHGFIVEEPRSDGTRRVGLASWTDGTVTWLVDDDRVNAHAALGPGGRLTWCRRAPLSDRFEIVMREGEREWIIGDERGSWLMPQWSATGEGVFALRLDDLGGLEAVYLHGGDEKSMKAAARLIRLSNAIDAASAIRVMAAQPVVLGVPLPREPMLVFQHPEFEGVGVWRPFRSDGSATRLLEYGSSAAAIDADGVVMYAATDGVKLQRLDDPAKQWTKLMSDVSLPVLTNSTAWRYLLYTPRRGGGSELAVVGYTPLGE